MDFYKLLGVVDAVANTDRGYNTNRRRAAVVAYGGFSLNDFLRDNSFPIHVGVVVGCVGFAGIGYLRRAHGAESWTLWGSLSLLCGGIAYYTRTVETVTPGIGGGAPTQSEEAKMIDSAKDWLDNKARELDKNDPGWEERTVQRVLR